MIPSRLLTRILLTLLLSLCSVAAAADGSHGDEPLADPLRPRPAVDAILAAYRTFPLVGFAETHGVQQEVDFLLQLVGDPRFASNVGNVVVEFGNALYQPVMDRYLLALEDVPRAELQKAWRNTTQFGPQSWDAPMYEQFFDGVRAVNDMLPAEQRIRVFLGDPPIDWQQVQTAAEFEQFVTDRDRHFAEVVEREILSKNRRALFVAGALHVMHQPYWPGEPRPFPTVTGLIEERRPGSVYVVAPHTGGITTGSMSECAVNEQFASWPNPSLAPIAGSWYGRLVAFDLMTPQGRVVRLLEQVVDAVVYIGRPEALEQVARTYVYYAEQPEYVQELKRRHMIAFGVPPDPNGVEHYRVGHPAHDETNH